LNHFLDFSLFDFKNLFKIKISNKIKNKIKKEKEKEKEKKKEKEKEKFNLNPFSSFIHDYNHLTLTHCSRTFQ